MLKCLFFARAINQDIGHRPHGRPVANPTLPARVVRGKTLVDLRLEGRASPRRPACAPVPMACEYVFGGDEFAAKRQSAG
ncbi:hypothetical protein D3C83_155140 [compost metagenome]